MLRIASVDTAFLEMIERGNKGIHGDRVFLRQYASVTSFIKEYFDLSIGLLVQVQANRAKLR